MSRHDTLIGICIDWTSSEMPNEKKSTLISLVQSSGWYVDYSPYNKFIDAYAEKPNKGTALVQLKSKLKVKGKVLYLGDSDSDNTAFEKSDAAIGVEHGQPICPLKCNHLIPHNKVGNFLELLGKEHLEFSSKLVQQAGGIEKVC